jgi:hypothetical protein
LLSTTSTIGPTSDLASTRLSVTGAVPIFLPPLHHPQAGPSAGPGAAPAQVFFFKMC